MLYCHVAQDQIDQKLKELQEEIAKQKAETEKLTKAKREYLANSKRIKQIVRHLRLDLIAVRSKFEHCLDTCNTNAKSPPKRVLMSETQTAWVAAVGDICIAD